MGTKKLMLIRHAKSDWGDIGLRDFDRPLNARGLKNAPEMADRLLSKSIVPQHIISSPALRAKTTAGIFAKHLHLAEPNYKPEIYNASYATLLGVINKIPDAYDFVAITGHNPGLSEVLYNLSGQIYDMPTCAVVVLSFEFESWALVSGHTGALEYYDFPKNNDD